MTLHKLVLIRATGLGAMLLAGALMLPSATAQSSRSLGQVSAVFTYHPQDPAETIYAHLRASAREACADYGSRSLSL